MRKLAALIIVISSFLFSASPAFAAGSPGPMVPATLATVAFGGSIIPTTNVALMPGDDMVVWQSLAVVSTRPVLLGTLRFQVHGTTSAIKNLRLVVDGRIVSAPTTVTDGIAILDPFVVRLETGVRMITLLADVVGEGQFTIGVGKPNDIVLADRDYFLQVLPTGDFPLMAGPQTVVPVLAPDPVYPPGRDYLLLAKSGAWLFRGGITRLSGYDGIGFFSQTTPGPKENGQYMDWVPIRAVAEALGYQVIWDTEKKRADLITSVNGSHVISLTVGESFGLVEGVKTPLTAPDIGVLSVIMGDRLMVPLPFVLNHLGWEHGRVSLLEQGPDYILLDVTTLG